MPDREYKRPQRAQTARRVDERTDRHRPDGGLDDQYDDRVERDDRGQFLCCAGNDQFGHQAGCPVPALEAEVARLRSALEAIRITAGRAWVALNPDALSGIFAMAEQALQGSPGAQVGADAGGAPNTTTPREEPQHGGG